MNLAGGGSLLAGVACHRTAEFVGVVRERSSEVGPCNGHPIGAGQACARGAGQALVTRRKRVRVHVLEAGTVLPEHDHGPLMVKVEAFAYVTRSPLSGRAALQLIVTV